MKKSSKNLVLYTLATANAPLTLRELVFRTSRSYNTIKKVLDQEPRVTSSGKHPAKYHLAKPEELGQDVILIEFDTPKEGWVAWVDRVAPKIPTLVKIDKTRKEDELYTQGVVIEALALNLIQVARKLKENSSKPDWFTLMGGDEND